MSLLQSELATVSDLSFDRGCDLRGDDKRDDCSNSTAGAPEPAVTVKAHLESEAEAEAEATATATKQRWVTSEKNKRSKKRLN